MSDFNEHLAKLLRHDNEALWAAVRKAFEKRAPDEAECPGSVGTIREILGTDHSRNDSLSTDLEEVFRDQVITRIPRLAPIKAKDLASIAIAQLTALNWDDDEIVWGQRRFLGFAFAEVLGKREGEKRFSLNVDGWPWATKKGGDPEEWEAWEEDSIVWVSQTGLKLALYVEPCESLGHKVEASLRGGFTDLAMKAAEEQMRGILESVVRTIILGVRLAEEDCAQMPEGNLDIICLSITGFPDEPIQHDRPPLFAPLQYLTIGEGHDVLKTCLTAVLDAEGIQEDMLLQRLHNATLLLSHADGVRSDPVSLALSFAAIEALLCEKDELPVNKQIKRHVATLLVQDAARRTAAERAVSRLYTIRCDVMHGNKVAASTAASQAVRRIAAGVIRAVVCWRENQLKVGGDTGWKELMDEVNAASRKPGIVVGVPDLSELIPNQVPK